MFTGIIEEIGRVAGRAPNKLAVRARKVLEDLKVGDSISVNGACLTVISLGRDSFEVELMPETLRRTNLGLLRAGDPVNLERALQVGGRLGGHFVQGHVDGTGRIVEIRREEGAVLMRISAPPEIMRYVVEKGFIAIDGASITVVERRDDSFLVSLVTFTLENSTLGSKRVGDLVNLEVDILAKYVERLLEGREGRKGITLDFLAEHGFL